MFALRSKAPKLAALPQQSLRQASGKSSLAVGGTVLAQAKSTLQVTKRNMWQVAKDEEGYMVYRKMVPPSKVDQRSAKIVGAMFWWWLTWHFMTESGHITGADHPYVYGSEWSDAQLGIPPDD